MIRHHADSTALCRYVRAETGPATLLSFSAGKDAVCAWLRLREHFERVVPFYLYLVPGLEFVEDGLVYYERVFGVPIQRMPHPSLPRMLRELVFQAPERCAAVEAADVPKLTYMQVEDHVRSLAGTPEAMTAMGVRAVDSPMRMASVRKHGSVTPARRTFLPVYDWRIGDVVAAMTRAGVRLTVDYEMFGRSFDGIDYRFLAPVKARFPRDYARILEWFPLADLELHRRRLG